MLMPSRASKAILVESFAVALLLPKSERLQIRHHPSGLRPTGLAKQKAKPLGSSNPNGMYRKHTPGEDHGSGHFYFALTRSGWLPDFGGWLGFLRSGR
jgi:hypothetical protein